MALLILQEPVENVVGSTDSSAVLLIMQNVSVVIILVISPECAGEKSQIKYPNFTKRNPPLK